jgi:DNA-binding response OmpR family regulator
MPDLLFLSSNPVFKEDLQKQIELEAPEFKTNVENAEPDAALIDEDTTHLCTLTARYPHIPFFVLLKAGAEKPKASPLVRFIVKPLTLSSFLNELRAGINLSTASDAGRLRFGAYELDPLKKEICHISSGETFKLTEKEISVIQYLYKIRNRIVTKNELLSEVWGYSPDATTHTIETHIYRLRQKVEQDGQKEALILTQDGGYLLARS